MTLQNVTVIIPAHNRPERLRRLLDYYSRTDIKILVPDSSDHPFADAEKYPDITYLHRPKLHFLLKLKEVLPMISTPYVLYCADDDFAVPADDRLSRRTPRLQHCTGTLPDLHSP